jgi:group I intron endonuclease
MEQYWIYKIINIVDNKVYIGSSLNVKQRKLNHFRNLKSETHHSLHLQRAYNKHGRGNFLFDIIEVGDYNFSYLELLLKEDKWVLYYDSLDPNKGYNKVLPSSQTFLEYSIDRSKNGYAKYILKNAPHCLTKISKEEWIEKRKQDPTFSIKNEKAKRPPFIKRKTVVVLNIKTNELKEYPSVISCSEALKTLEVRISNCINQNILYCQYHKVYKGLLITTKDNFQPNPEIRLKPRKQRPKKETPVKPIIILPIIKIQNIDTLEVKEFNYYTEIASFLDTKPCRIMELKKGFKNKGNGVIQKITHFKKWRVFDN